MRFHLIPVRMTIIKRNKELPILVRTGERVFHDFSWRDMSKHLFTPDRVLKTEQRRDEFVVVTGDGYVIKLGNSKSNAPLEKPTIA